MLEGINFLHRAFNYILVKIIMIHYVSMSQHLFFKFLMKQNKAILKLVQKYGSLTALANRIGVSRGSVAHWLYGRRKVSVKLVKKIIELSEGELTREDIRPDVYKD